MTRSENSVDDAFALTGVELLGQAGEAYEVGGLYGMALGRVFFGESIFTHKPNAGKVALLALARMLAEQGYALIDCQMQSPLLASMGARNIARHRFERLLVTNGATTLAPGTWQAGPIRLTPTF